MKCIIFDWGGVCTKSHLISNFSREIEKRLGVVSNIVYDTFLDNNKKFMLGKISSDEFWKSFSSITGISVKEAKNLFIETQNVNPDAIDYIAEIKASYSTALLTNNYYDLLENIKENYSDYFDFIFSSNELNMKKPEAQIYEKALSVMGYKAKECVFIDDKKENLKSARELGITAIKFEDLGKLKNDLSLILNK
ncbi:MAG: HAD family hydrolase [Nanobdellota archaeon]